MNHPVLDMSRTINSGASNAAPQPRLTFRVKMRVRMEEMIDFEEASDGISDNLSTVQQKNFRIYLQSGQASRPLFLSLILIELGLERELTMLVAEALPTRLPCPAV